MIRRYKRKKQIGTVSVMHIGLTADSAADLVGHVSDLVNRIRQEVVCFQEVKGAERQQLEGDAHVAVVVKPVQHLHTVTDGRRDTALNCIRQKIPKFSPNHKLLTVCWLDLSRLSSPAH